MKDPRTLPEVLENIRIHAALGFGNTCVVYRKKVPKTVIKGLEKLGYRTIVSDWAKDAVALDIEW
jgi:hypothetical protein